MSASAMTVPSTRRTLVAVAVPNEHGGWGLTLEPALLGLLIAPTAAGVALALAALVAFVARTPARVVLVDRWRGRRLERTVLAEKVLAVEVAVLAALAVFAVVTAHGPFWVPLAIAVPLVVVELWFDTRSRSRRLVPELAGTIAVGSVAASIVLADAGRGRLAAGLWLVVAARALASVPFVRVQLKRAKQQPHRLASSDVAQAVAVAVAGLAVVLDQALAGGLVSIVGLAVVQVVAIRLRPPSAPILGAQQVVFGLTVVLVTGLWVLAP